MAVRKTSRWSLQRWSSLNPACPAARRLLASAHRVRREFRRVAYILARTVPTAMPRQLPGSVTGPLLWIGVMAHNSRPVRGRLEGIRRGNSYRPVMGMRIGQS